MLFFRQTRFVCLIMAMICVPNVSLAESGFGNMAKAMIKLAQNADFSPLAKINLTRTAVLTDDAAEEKQKRDTSPSDSRSIRLKLHVPSGWKYLVTTKEGYPVFRKIVPTGQCLAAFAPDGTSAAYQLHFGNADAADPDGLFVFEQIKILAGGITGIAKPKYKEGPFSWNHYLQICGRVPDFINELTKQ